MIPVFLLYGFLACTWGYSAWQDWRSISPALRMLSILFALAGPLMLVSALWVLSSLGRSSLALKLGGLAAASFGLLQAIGALTEIMPCSGPT